MFGLFRTALLVLIAFAAGLLFAGSNATEACEAAGGEMAGGICRGVPK